MRLVHWVLVYFFDALRLLLSVALDQSILSCFHRYQEKMQVITLGPSYHAVKCTNISASTLIKRLLWGPRQTWLFTATSLWDPVNEPCTLQTLNLRLLSVEFTDNVLIFHLIYQTPAVFCSTLVQSPTPSSYLGSTGHPGYGHQPGRRTSVKTIEQTPYIEQVLIMSYYSVPLPSSRGADTCDVDDTPTAMSNAHLKEKPAWLKQTAAKSSVSCGLWFRSLNPYFKAARLVTADFAGWHRKWIYFETSSMPICFAEAWSALLRCNWRYNVYL